MASPKPGSPEPADVAPSAAAADQDKEPNHAKLAREALNRGQTAAASGDAVGARRWFERASRLAPGDDTVNLCLAGACLNLDDNRAAELFGQVLELHDLQPAWTGLALARLRLGQPALAADAIAAALSRFAINRPNEIVPIADQIVQATGAPGWCGLQWRGKSASNSEPGFVILIGPSGKVQLSLDGQPAPARGNRLPAGWQQAKRLDIHRNGQPLLGSPIDIAALRRTDGCVWTSDDGAGNWGLEGWAWHPGNPEADPVLTVRVVPAPGTARGHQSKPLGQPLTIIPSDLQTSIAGTAILAQPRRFHMSAAALALLAGNGRSARVSVTDGTGRQLSGSPIDPWVLQREAAAASLAVADRFPAGNPEKRGSRRPPVDVVIPVHGGGKVTLDCIDTVLATLPRTSRLVVVDDASTTAENGIDLVLALDSLAAAGRIQLIRQTTNLGFPASANAGLRACDGRDVVLLNSDTLVPLNWLQRLRDAAYAAPDIGSVTPLSNDATILSYPHRASANPTPTLDETKHLDQLAAEANGGTVIDIPTAVGFCMYIRRDCLNMVGALREDLFAQGYGEENDFCMRARYLGWRHVAAPGVYVAHRSGQSFGNARAHLLARNAAVLDRLHPSYAALIAEHSRTDPLAEARRKIDLARWKEARLHKPARRNGPREKGKQTSAGRSAMILITHFHGGGTERQLRVQIEAARQVGQRPIVLRPARLPDGSTAVMLGDGEATDYPNLRFALPDELPALVRVLSAERPIAAQVHHLLGHDYSVLSVLQRLGIPYDVHIHDFAAFCPRVGLLGPQRRYCGEPEITECEACIADIGRKDGLEFPVADLRQRSAALFASASRVAVPSQDTASRIRRHFPAITPVVVEHDDDAEISDPSPPRLVRPSLPDDKANRPVCRVAVIGAIGLEKGYEVLLACARDAAWRDLPLEFIVIGHSIDDKRLLATGRVFITGEYRPEEAVELIRAQQASLALIPSVWPETWCFTLTEAWQAGLNAACFDIGAPAERIRRSGRGLVLPLGLSANAINHQLISATGLARDEMA